MTLVEILVLMLVAAAAYFIWSNLKARETANVAIRAACEAARMLFLNDTVGLESFWFVRHEDGRLRLRRVYGFEYSDTGLDRRRGTVTMIGDTVSAVDVGARQAPAGETLH
jgi:hypothetical protein